MATPKQGSAFENPMYIDGIMKGKDKNGDTVWIAMKTAGMGGGVNPIYVVDELPDPNTCQNGTFFVIEKE